MALSSLKTRDRTDIDSLLSRVGTAENDIGALEAADIAIDTRLDAIETTVAAYGLPEQGNSSIAITAGGASTGTVDYSYVVTSFKNGASVTLTHNIDAWSQGTMVITINGFPTSSPYTGNFSTDMSNMAIALQARTDIYLCTYTAATNTFLITPEPTVAITSLVVSGYVGAMVFSAPRYYKINAFATINFDTSSVLSSVASVVVTSAPNAILEILQPSETQYIDSFYVMVGSSATARTLDLTNTGVFTVTLSLATATRQIRQQTITYPLPYLLV